MTDRFAFLAIYALGMLVQVARRWPSWRGSLLEVVTAVLVAQSALLAATLARLVYDHVSRVDQD